MRLFLSLLAVCFTFNVFATEKDDAVKTVDAAAQFIETNGAEKGLAEINKADGQFVKGSLYVFAYDMKGVMKAHPKNPKLIGKDLLNTPDASGKMFRKEIVETAQKSGTGWVDYKYKNPESGKIEDKTTYLKKVGELVVCAGVYK